MTRDELIEELIDSMIDVASLPDLIELASKYIRLRLRQTETDELIDDGLSQGIIESPDEVVEV